MGYRKALVVAEHFCAQLPAWLRGNGFSVTIADPHRAADLFRQIQPHVVVVAALESAGDSLDLVRCIRRTHAHTPVVMIVERSSEDLAIAALHAGVTHYMRHPVSQQILAEALPETADAEPEELSGVRRLIGMSSQIAALRLYIQRIAGCTSNVLITGETGTGKELVAELIHENSDRRSRPFIPLNTTAIPDALIESELFGYERGAFTGAYAGQRGKLSMAHSGTFFFDEIGDISPAVQAKLLRAIESKPVYRLGGDKAVPIDVRFLAATNQDLESAVAQGRFRRDLFYRLNVVRVQLPALRDRKEDIPSLVSHYIAHFNQMFNASVQGLTAAAMDRLLAYAWPGNIRELRNVIEVVFVNLGPGASGLAGLPARLDDELKRISACAADGRRDQLVSALISTNWNKTQAARKLHWSRMTLYRHMTRYKIARGSA